VAPLSFRNRQMTKASPTGQGLLSGSFLGLLFTQFLTAMNDNVFRWLVIGIGKDYVEPSEVGMILTLGTVLFVAPYLGFAAIAGYLADRFPKSRVVLGCKIAEILIMVLGVVAIFLQSLPMLFVAVFLMGAQSAFFSPAKLGSIPEILKPEKVSLANGLFGLTTVGATMIGMAVGNKVTDLTGLRGVEQNGWLPAAVLLGIAVVGTLFSLLMRPLPVANAARQFPWNFPVQTFRDLRTLTSRGPLFRVALGSMFFWSLGALAQLNIDQFAFEGGASTETQKVPLLLCLVVGLGLGAVLAGIWSRGRVELGLLPLGAFGIVIFCFLLFLVQGAIFQLDEGTTETLVWACVFLGGLGFSAGLFDVPINAYMQQRSPRETRGSILAASNFLTFTGVALVAVVFAVVRHSYSPGALENVEVSHITKQHRQAIDNEMDRYGQDWEASADQSQIKAVLDASPELSRQHLLVNLLWLDIKSRDAEHKRAEPGNVESGSILLSRKDYLQHFSGEAELVSQVYTQATGPPLLTANQIFLVCGIGTVPVLFYILWLIPQATLRFLVWLLSNTVYRIRIYGSENIPAEGGALFLPNHVSWLDGVLLLLISDRPIRMVVYAGNFKSPLLIWLGKLWGVVLLPTRPKALARTIESTRALLQEGELVCIFPEGAISRTGHLQAFKRGALKIHEGTNVPIVPVYFNELWGSIFSFEGGRFFWKWPRRWPYPVSIYIGKPLTDSSDTHAVRQAVQQLGVEAVEQQLQSSETVTSQFVRKCKRRKFTSKVSDSSGIEMTGGQLLVRTLIFRRLLLRKVLQADEKYIAVLLPPSAFAVVTNAAIALMQRVSVNLNYSASTDVVNHCLAECGIQHILTSRKFVKKLASLAFDVEALNAELVYLEDLRELPTLTEKFWGAIDAYCTPGWLLQRRLGLHRMTGEDVLTVIFTSGSTGQPKGVMLTQKNISSNIRAIEAVIRFSPEDVLVGLLPFFHSFGYTVTLWGALGIDIKGVYHFNPLEAKQIGKLVKKHHGTVLLATPTFLRSYLRRCKAEEFSSLSVVVAGAEKLPRELCDAFEEKFGVRPVEGYGSTELSPLASVNIPPTRSVDGTSVDLKEGTVGRAIPGVAARIVNLDTGEILGTNQTGMLQVKGPNVMKGYLNRPDLTAEAIQDGWYVTGDVALIDEDGFIKITGRESRFSKIGGEMVPHIQIEEAITRLLENEEEEFLPAAVTAIPHAKKGERLIVIHRKIDQTPQQLCEALAEEGLPKLYIPSPDSFFEVEELPLLGSGKLDLKQIREIALNAFSSADS